MAVLDVVVLVGLQAAGVGQPDLTELLKAIGPRGVATAAAPVIVLLLTSLLPSEFKAMLVYWRLRDVLPSHRAFSVHAPRDSRINLEALRRNVGDFPEAPRDQSSRWYQLYTKVGNNVPIVGAHRHFLLFRDMAAMSVVLLVVVPAALWFVDKPLALPAAILFAVQYVLAAIAARHNGIRMVTNVLALHSTKKVG
ncbi:MAG TPA: hypothetical protein VGI91_11335 [Steroidobacteraceae bacterium]